MMMGDRRYIVMYFLDWIFVDVCILRLHWIIFWGTKKGGCMYVRVVGILFLVLMVS